MASKTFVDYDTSIVIDAAWANDVDYLTYDILSFADGGSTLTVTKNTTFSGNATVQGAFTSLGIDDNATGTKVTVTDASTDLTHNLTFSSANPTIEMVATATNDAKLGLYEGSNTVGAEIVFDGGTNELQILSGNGSMTERMSMDRDTGIFDFTATALHLTTSSDASVGGPDFRLYRYSNTPATNDTLGEIEFIGNDDAGGNDTYAAIAATIADPTDGAEYGGLVFKTESNSSLTNKAHIKEGMYLGSATGGDQGVGTINATGVYKNGTELHPLTSDTAQPSTSGTSIDFTGIPSWVKRITLTYFGLSTSGTSGFCVQIGDSGGLETTGYKSSTASFSGGTTATQTTQFIVKSTITAADEHGGSVTFTNVDGNKWVMSGNGYNDTASYGYQCAGFKELSATLDRLRLKTLNGTDTFDAGTVNILYE